ncbi:MAG: RodZ domain-containing protein [Bacillota bacterium]
MAGDLEYKEKLREMGSEIRARRESLGLSVEDASNKTRLRAKYLLAVEEGNDAEAPGTTYFRAFLKTYATFLGLDGSAYSMAYQKALEERDAPQPKGKPKPQPSAPAKPADRPVGAAPEPKVAPDAVPPPSLVSSAPPAPQLLTAQVSRPAGPKEKKTPQRRAPRQPRKSGSSAIWVFLLVFALAAGAYVVYTLQNSRPPEPPVAVTPDPETDPEPAEPTVTEPPEPPAPTVVRTEVNPEAVTFTVGETPLELTMKTGESEDSFCWVRVQADGELLFEKTMAPGQEEKITADSEIIIRAGKPWVLTLMINGEDQGPAGEFGPVKDITITAAP